MQGMRRKGRPFALVRLICLWILAASLVGCASKGGWRLSDTLSSLGLLKGEEPGAEGKSAEEGTGLPEGPEWDPSLAPVPGHPPPDGPSTSAAPRFASLRDSRLHVVSPLPIEEHPRIDALVRYYQREAPLFLRRSLAKSTKYLPMMWEIFREEGIPEELAYLALVESGFNPLASSSARCVGMWQFLEGSGRKYGLRIDGWVDERLDPERSTRAAALYLKQLYGLFEDWELAIAGFNAGERTISDFLARRRASSFSELCQYPGLRQVTKDFVPKFQATVKIARDPERYGFSELLYEEPWRFERVKVSQQLSLETIARLAGADPREVQGLNPQLKRRVSPPGPSEVELRLPEGTGENFNVQLAQRPPGTKESLEAQALPEGPARMIPHWVKSKETLTDISRRYGVQVATIQEVNSLISPQRLRAGSMLRIPLPAQEEGGGVPVSSPRSGGVRAKAAPQDVAKDSKKSRALVHRVKKGENLWSISRQYGVQVEDLCKWNGLKGYHITPGDQLTIRQ